MPRGQCKALLVEGLEHGRLVRVLRREFLPVAAPPPGDLLLQEEAALDEVLDVALLERALLLGRRWRRVSPELPEVEDPDAAGEAAMAMVVEHWQEEEIARKKKAESSGDSPSWLRRRKALECSGMGWLLRAASPV